ncbi:MAG: DUF4412 domain-containing protein [Candidatus Korobacteraceae bacterium]
MKPAPRLIFALFISLLLLQIAVAQVPQISPFSADMQITSTSDRAPHDVTGQVYVGSGHIRMNMDSAGHATAMITDLATQTTDILLVEQKMYIEQKAGKMPGRNAGNVTQDLKSYDPQNPCANQPDLTCKKIGVEDVSGRTCDHWQITDKQARVTDLWIDQKLHFPVKVVSKDATMLLTNIKEGQPDASLFQVPAGYHKLDMGGMVPPGAGGPPHN